MTSKNGYETATERARAAIVVPELRSALAHHTLEQRLVEFQGLAEAIDLEIVEARAVRLREARAATYLGVGVIAEITEKVAAEDIDLVLVDAALTPVQQRNLEKAFNAKVLDRTGLILEIFGDRAATREGVLQVELAHLNYQKGRLVRSWTHLERQRGGGGFIGGPGETQIESDRRQLQDRIIALEARLSRVSKSREQQRGPRSAGQLPTIALVGYTNAGKSTLFNKLTGAEVMAKDMLFATLDPTLRKLKLPHGKMVVLSDTVGFIADLPTDLIAAFRATLEEVRQADLILHVRDAANPDAAAQAVDVFNVLAMLDVHSATTPMIEVWNKIDLLPAGEGATVSAPHAAGMTASVRVSASSGEGMGNLLTAIETALASTSRTITLHLAPEQGADLAWIYAHGEVLDRSEEGTSGVDLKVRIMPRDNAAFSARFGPAAQASGT